MTEENTAVGGSSIADLAAARIAEICDLVSETFYAEPDHVQTAASFKDDLGADSLMAFELFTRIEERYAITLADEDLPLLTVDLRTVCEVVATRAGW
jgi:acyl carrier protein